MNDDNNLTNENQPSGEEPTKDKIPLWLQGLDDEVKEESTDLPEELENTEDSWVKEIDQEGEELVDNGDTQAKANKEVQLPDWIRENDELKAEEPVANDLSKDSDEKTADENAPLRVSSTEFEPNEEELPQNEPTDHGFIDISELDMEDSRDPVQFIPIEEEDVNEELPAWLHDMINDQPDHPIAQTAQEEFEENLEQDQPEITSEQRPDLKTKDDQWQEITTVKDNGLPVQEDADIGEQFSEQFEEEVTKPVQIESGTADEWIQVNEDFVLTEDQNTFGSAKALLDQGNLTAAIEILSGALEGSPSKDDLDKIQSIIDNAAEKSEEEKSALLELKGDVALKLNDPSGAFQAYAQALKTLLSQKEVEDGTS